MNEPSATAIWKKLNEITDKLHQLSEQLARADAKNESYHRALDQHRIKIEELEREKHRMQGSLSTWKSISAFIFAVVLAGGSWTIVSINELKQNMAVVQSQRESKNETYTR